MNFFLISPIFIENISIYQKGICTLNILLLPVNFLISERIFNTNQQKNCTDNSFLSYQRWYLIILFCKKQTNKQTETSALIFNAYNIFADTKKENPPPP